jgi:hypothetical protein
VHPFPELFVHLFCFDTLFGGKHPVELRRRFGMDRYELSQETTLLAGEFLDLIRTPGSLGCGSQPLMVLFQLLSDWLRGLLRLLEDHAGLLFLRIGKI